MQELYQLKFSVVLMADFFKVMLTSGLRRGIYEVVLMLSSLRQEYLEITSSRGTLSRIKGWRFPKHWICIPEDYHRLVKSAVSSKLVL